MNAVGREPAVSKTKHYFDPESLEDLTACVPIRILREELEESRRGIIIDAYEIFSGRLGREHESELRTLAEDPVRYKNVIGFVLSIVGEPTDDDEYNLARLDDRIHEIDFTLGEISTRDQLHLQEEEIAAEAAADSGFALTSLLANNPAAEYVVAVVKNS